MSSLRPLHWQAAQHFDERFICRVSHFWASQNRPFGSLDTGLWEPNIYIWLFFFESSIRFLQVSKTFASCSFCLCTPLLTLTKTFVTRRSLSVMIAFPFFRSRFLLIFHLLFSFHVKFKKVSKDIKIFWTVHSRPFIRYQSKNLD